MRSGKGIAAGVVSGTLVEGEPIVTVDVNTAAGDVLAEPGAAPLKVVVLPLHDELTGPSVLILDVVETINVHNWDELERVVLEQLEVLLVSVHGGVEHLEEDVEAHLDRDGFSGMVGTCEEHAGSLRVRLGTHLKSDKGDVAALIGLSDRTNGNDIWELGLELLDEAQNVVVHQVDPETRDQSLQLDLVVPLFVVGELLVEGFFERNMVSWGAHVVELDSGLVGSRDELISGDSSQKADRCG